MSYNLGAIFQLTNLSPIIRNEFGQQVTNWPISVQVPKKWTQEVPTSQEESFEVPPSNIPKIIDVMQQPGGITVISNEAADAIKSDQTDIANQPGVITMDMIDQMNATPVDIEQPVIDTKGPSEPVFDTEATPDAVVEITQTGEPIIKSKFPTGLVVGFASMAVLYYMFFKKK